MCCPAPSSTNNTSLQAAGGWPLGAYARSAPHPRGTVVAQDFFRSGLLPADTDFRVFEASLLRWGPRAR